PVGKRDGEGLLSLPRFSSRTYRQGLSKKTFVPQQLRDCVSLLPKRHFRRAFPTEPAVAVPLIPEEEPPSRLQYPLTEVLVMIKIKPESLLDRRHSAHAPISALRHKVRRKEYKARI